MDIGCDLRGQIDYVVLLKDNNRDNREKAFKYFAGMFPSFAAFEETIRNCTEDNECMVIDNTSGSYNITDCVFFYKATQNLQYRLGNEKFWRVGTDMYEVEEDNLNDQHRAGMSKRDREKAKRFNVRKIYPDDDDYTPASTGHYAGVYRGHTRTKKSKRKMEQARLMPPQPLEHIDKTPTIKKKMKKKKKARKPKTTVKSKKKKKKNLHGVKPLKGILG